MILAVNAENSIVELGVFDEDKLILKQTMGAQKEMTDCEYAVAINSLLKFGGVCVGDITHSIISTVVPLLGISIGNALELLIGKKPLLVGTGVKTGLDVRLSGATLVGTDFVCNCVGCLCWGKLPAMVIDMGYVTTISVLDKTGAFVGRTIHCGGKMQLEALGEKTALLPTLSMTDEVKILGKTTAESVTLGAACTIAGTVEFMYRRMCKEYGDINVFITGGEAKHIKDYISFEYIYDADLAMKGLLAILKKNK